MKEANASAALKLALEALKKTQSEGYNLPSMAISEAILVAEAALAQPEQEPACVGTGVCVQTGLVCLGQPPQRKPLTDKQRTEIVKFNTVEGYHGNYYLVFDIIDDVEAAHGIKENT